MTGLFFLSGKRGRLMNVIFYAMDSLRADHLHCLGYPRPNTPVLDRLAAEGVLFSRCYAQGGWTAPSGASLLSSQYPSATGIHKMRDPLNAAMPWLPEALRERGFSTTGFSAIYQVSKLRGFDRGFDGFIDLFKDEETMARCREQGQDFRRDDYCLPPSDEIHRRALRWLDERESGVNGPSFFMFLWSIDTHEPFSQPARYNLYADPAYRGPVTGHGRPFRWVRHRRDLRQLIDLYDGSIRYQDEKLGGFVEQLDRRGVLDDTLLVLFGDHGEMFFEHGIAGHGKFPWEDLMRVPLIMRCPSVIPAGVRCDSIVNLLDVAPTVLDALGLGPEPRFRGRSLRPLFTQPDLEVHGSVIMEIPFPFDRSEQARVVREAAWKYVEYSPPPLGKRVRKVMKEIGRGLSVLVRPGMLPVLYGHQWRRGPVGLLKALTVEPALFLAGRPVRRLFDLHTDPREDHDQLRRQPEMTERLRSQFAEINQPLCPPSQEMISPPYSAAQEARVIEHLAQLGYVED